MRRRKRRRDRIVWLLYAALFVFLAAYVLTKLPLFGLAFVLLFIIIIAAEVRDSIRQEGSKKTLIELASAVGAIILIWIVMILLLGTNSPVDVVPSCSMIPYLHVGDIVLLHGMGNLAQFLRQHSGVPVVNVSSAAFDGMLSSMGNEYLSYYAEPATALIAYVTDYQDNYSIGLYNTKCLSAYSYLGQKSNFYKCYVPESSQKSNLIKYNYSIGKIIIGGITYKMVYTSGITIFARLSPAAPVTCSSIPATWSR